MNLLQVFLLYSLLIGHNVFVNHIWIWPECIVWLDKGIVLSIERVVLWRGLELKSWIFVERNLLEGLGWILLVPISQRTILIGLMAREPEVMGARPVKDNVRVFVLGVFDFDLIVGLRCCIATAYSRHMLLDLDSVSVVLQIAFLRHIHCLNHTFHWSVDDKVFFLIFIFELNLLLRWNAGHSFFPIHWHSFQVS